MEEKKERVRYNKVLLDECIVRDGATLIGEYKKLTRETNVYFICSCGQNGDNNLRMIKKTGAYCDTCVLRKKKEKTIKTNISKFGVSNPLQNIQIKAKQQETIKQKFGVDNISKNNSIKEKKRDTTFNNLGVLNPSQSEIIKQKKKETTQKNFGVNSPIQNILIKDKIKETNKAKYGVENPSQSHTIKEKKKITTFKHFGVEYSMQSAEVKEKSKNTCMIKYGVENAFQSEEVKQKAKNTNLERYGVEYTTQNESIMEKIQQNAKKYKKFKMPSGVLKNVQGYEPFALTELLQKYSEENLKTDRKDVPRVKYNYNSKVKYYFPDIYIPIDNKIIEVKSTWTIKLHEEQVKAKAEACRAQGYNYEIWCYDAKGKRIEVPNHPESSIDSPQEEQKS